MVVPRTSTRDELTRLMAEKDRIERLISEFAAILIANGNVGLDAPLVDAEGYPRNDIDIYQVRMARQQINCLTNDHRDLMSQIADRIIQVHQQAREEEGNDAGTSYVHVSAADPPAEDVASLSPIVSVNVVSPGSPSEEAGMRVGDMILQFGSINCKNFENNLNQIGALVKNMENQNILLKVRRSAEILDLILIPKKWSGHGLLGCNIVLPESVER